MYIKNVPHASVRKPQINHTTLFIYVMTHILTLFYFFFLNDPPPPEIPPLPLPAPLPIYPTPSGTGACLVDDRGRSPAVGDAARLPGLDPHLLAPGEKMTSLSATPSGAGYWIFTNQIGRAHV